MDRSTTFSFRKTSLALGIVFALGASGVAATTFQSLDTDNDGSISRDEYYGYAGDAGVYGNWDLNDDGLLSEDEWDTDYDYDYTAWDTDNDGYLTEDEFFDGTFDYYDDNDDGYWEDDEWADAEDEEWWDIL